MGKHLGFSGTSALTAVSEERRDALNQRLQALRQEGYEILHHGDCAGADELAHRLALDAGFQVVIHPSVKTRERAWCKGALSERLPLGPPARNAGIVMESDLVLVMPRDAGRREVLTNCWSVMHHANDLGVPAEIV